MRFEARNVLPWRQVVGEGRVHQDWAHALTIRPTNSSCKWQQKGAHIACTSKGARTLARTTLPPVAGKCHSVTHIGLGKTKSDGGLSKAQVSLELCGLNRGGGEQRGA